MISHNNAKIKIQLSSHCDSETLQTNMSSAWRYLNSPELVFKVQSFFGVESLDQDEKKFHVKNRFFYFLFLLGTELGDEIFYGIFIPVFFFNVDCFVGRRFVFHWFLNMYVGQALKEVFTEERPKPPAIQMQKKWNNEYSLPSTHAMGSLSMASAIVYFSLSRWNLNLTLGITFVVLWVTVISLSRVYLGMHSVLDLLLGIAISSVLLLITLPLTNSIEYFIATNLISPLLVLIIPVLLIIYFPTTKVWTPTRGDTCIVAAVFTGIELGIWFNYQMGIMKFPAAGATTSLELGNIYHLVARTIAGLAIVGLTEFLGKFLTFSILSMIIGEDKKALKASENSIANKSKTFVDLTSKFLTYSILGFNTIVLVPITYKLLNIQRDAFFNEL